MSNAASETVASAIRELVDANHILFDQGVVDGFGHVSARHPERPDRFLLARSMAPALVTEKDVLEFDLDGNPVESGGPAPYLERFIHGEIYRKRQDVMSVVHSHSPSVVPVQCGDERPNCVPSVTCADSSARRERRSSKSATSRGKAAIS